MGAWLRQFALCFAAGCVGGLAKSAAAWGAYRLGVTVLIGGHGANALTPGALYPRVIWGGLWAALFLLPFLRNRIFLGGLLAGAIVTLVQWVVLPLWWHSGLNLALMPMLDALLLNLIWGVVTALVLKWL
jgi:hypothetical protein